MTAHTPDALASALPDGVSTEIRLDKPLWFRRKIAAYQAERLAEAGYVLVHTAPDEATVERLAEALVENSWPVPTRIMARDHVRAVLAALGAPEQTGPDRGQGEAVRTCE